MAETMNLVICDGIIVDKVMQGVHSFLSIYIDIY